MLNLSGAAFLLSLAAVLLAGCLGNWGFVHDEPLAGPYRLVAVDDREQMIVCRSLEGGNCSGDGLPDQTVFAAGADDRYLVIARHPSVFGEPMNKAVTEYYFAERSANEGDPRSRPTLDGPYDEAEFEEAAQRLGLPEFSIVFDDLK